MAVHRNTRHSHSLGLQAQRKLLHPEPHAHNACKISPLHLRHLLLGELVYTHHSRGSSSACLLPGRRLSSPRAATPPPSAAAGARENTSRFRLLAGRAMPAMLL